MYVCLSILSTHFSRSFRFTHKHHLKVFHWISYAHLTTFLHFFFFNHIFGNRSTRPLNLNIVRGTSFNREFACNTCSYTYTTHSHRIMANAMDSKKSGIVWRFHNRMRYEMMLAVGNHVHHYRSMVPGSRRTKFDPEQWHRMDYTKLVNCSAQCDDFIAIKLMQ